MWYHGRKNLRSRRKKCSLAPASRCTATSICRSCWTLAAGGWSQPQSTNEQPSTFSENHGEEIAVKPWEGYVECYPQKVMAWDETYAESVEQLRKWPLQHFIDSGAAED